MDESRKRSMWRLLGCSSCLAGVWFLYGALYFGWLSAAEPQFSDLYASRFAIYALLWRDSSTLPQRESASRSRPIPGPNPRRT